jgi:hypothetical protein
MPKRSRSRRKTHLERAAERALKLEFKVSQLNRKIEDIWIELGKESARGGAKRDFDLGLSFLATHYDMTGQNRRAEGVLRQREQASPKAIEPKLAWARYFGTSLQNPQRALEHLDRARLPKHPRGTQADSCFNYLAYRGLMLLQLGKKSAASSAMDALAKFTERHIGDTIFFFDMYFVRGMIEKRWAIPACRRYLKAISSREQVSHDAAETKRLLSSLNISL